MKQYTLNLITPLFSTGVDKNQPEVRAPSIRGQLHWWFRALGGAHELEKEVFGGVHSGPRASRLVVRVVCGQMPAAQNFPTLPHKSGNYASPKAAFPPGSSFRVAFSQRLDPLSSAAQSMLDRTIKMWLLCGSLGLRSTRGGGAFHVKCAPENAAEYLSMAKQLIGQSSISIAVLPKTYPSAEAARIDITDTQSHDEMRAFNFPLGKIKNGRKTSPLRLTVRKFANGFHIVAVWDARQVVTGNTSDHLRGAVKNLEQRSVPMGLQLATVIDQLAR